MNEAVIPELQLLAFSVAAGILSFCGYDLLLAVRAFLRQSVILEKLSDVLYWTAASVLVFSMIHEKNSGVIRGYSILGMLLGMIAYRAAMKDRIVRRAHKVADAIRAWMFRRAEPVRKWKKELQNRRKQSKIKQKEQRKKRREERRAGEGKKWRRRKKERK